MVMIVVGVSRPGETGEDASSILKVRNLGEPEAPC
jgi:hypothetical protein